MYLEPTSTASSCLQYKCEYIVQASAEVFSLQCMFIIHIISSLKCMHEHIEKHQVWSIYVLTMYSTSETFGRTYK